MSSRIMEDAVEEINPEDDLLQRNNENAVEQISPADAVDQANAPDAVDQANAPDAAEQANALDAAEEVHSLYAAVLASAADAVIMQPNPFPIAVHNRCAYLFPNRTEEDRREIMAHIFLLHELNEVRPFFISQEELRPELNTLNDIFQVLFKSLTKLLYPQELDEERRVSMFIQFNRGLRAERQSANLDIPQVPHQE